MVRAATYDIVDAQYLPGQIPEPELSAVSDGSNGFFASIARWTAGGPCTKESAAAKRMIKDLRAFMRAREGTFLKFDEPTIAGVSAMLEAPIYLLQWDAEANVYREAMYSDGLSPKAPVIPIHYDGEGTYSLLDQEWLARQQPDMQMRDVHDAQLESPKSQKSGSPRPTLQGRSSLPADRDRANIVEPEVPVSMRYPPNRIST